MIVVPTLHPAFLLRTSNDDSKGEARFTHIVKQDVARAVALITRKPAWDESVIWSNRTKEGPLPLFPTLPLVRAFVKEAIDTQRIVWIDVEATGESPMECTLLCVGMGFTRDDGSESVVCVPFLRQGGLPYWSVEGLEECRGLIAKLVEHCETGYQNGAYDTIVLWRHGMAVWKWTEDTMAAHHLRDVLCTMRSFPPLRREVAGLKLDALYRQEVRLAQIMSAGTVRGIMVDEERRKALGEKLTIQREDALAIIRRIAQNPAFNPASIIQLRALLFDTLKFPIVSRTAKGAPSTDKKAMVLLAASADTDDQRDVLSALMKWRRTSKLISTYVEGLPILSDGRLHATWKCLTVTGRFATTPNAQNWPPSVKKLFRAAPGYRLVSVDLSQAELRVIAYFSQDPELLLAYREGLNVHTMNTSLSFHVRTPGLDTNEATEAYLTKAVPQYLHVPYDSLPVAPKAQWKMMRRLAKNLAFGDNYGATAETLFEFIRAQRDPETDQPYFPDLTLADVEAWKATWETKLHPSIPRWWQKITNGVNTARKYQDPYSGRTRWFRAGFKRNEILNTPVQGLVASYMNDRTLEIANRLAIESPGSALILQVHDMVCVEAPEADVPIVRKILQEVFARSFKLRAPYLGGPEYDDAILPADEATDGVYLDEV
jgi:DNA polymerase I-like protein with 3'-5' exonuclease and polymerase domains